MRNILLALFFCAFFATGIYAQQPDQPGPYSVTQLDTSFQDTFYTNDLVNLRLYHPALDTLPAGTSFPSIAFGHGFTVPHTAYEGLCTHLASHGYLVVAVDEQNGLSISHLTFAEQLAASIRWLQMLGTGGSGHWLEGRVGSTSGAFGHSMGGGSSMLLPGVWTGITAVAGLAAAETDPSAIADLQGRNIPMLHVTGKGDSVTSEVTDQLPMLAANDGPELWVSLLNGGHSAFTDQASATCEFGATTVGDAGTLSYDVQQGRAKRYLTAFFGKLLKSESSWDPWLCGDSLAADSLIRYESRLCQTSRDLRTDIQPLPYPNPSHDTVHLHGATGLTLWSLDGRKVSSSASSTISVRHLPDGLYVLEAHFPDGRRSWHRLQKN